jgi:hypothetical protein
MPLINGLLLAINLVGLNKYNMPLINGLLLAINLVGLNNKINVLILSDHDDIEYNYNCNIFNNFRPIST